MTVYSTGDTGYSSSDRGWSFCGIKYNLYYVLRKVTVLSDYKT